MNAIDTPLTAGQACLRLGILPWHLKALHDRGLYPERPRLGRYRIYRASELGDIKAALIAAGYLKPEAATVATAAEVKPEAASE